MSRQTPSGPTFTQTPLPCEPEPDRAGAVAEGVPTGADAGAEVADVPGLGATWLGSAPPPRRTAP